MSKEGLRYEKIRGPVRIAAGTGYLKQLEKLSATASVESVNRWDEDQNFSFPFLGKPSDHLAALRHRDSSRNKSSSAESGARVIAMPRAAMASEKATPRQIDLLRGLSVRNGVLTGQAQRFDAASGSMRAFPCLAPPCRTSSCRIGGFPVSPKVKA